LGSDADQFGTLIGIPRNPHERAELMALAIDYHRRRI
jgi:hypothetical protein